MTEVVENMSGVNGQQFVTDVGMNSVCSLHGNKTTKLLLSQTINGVPIEDTNHR